MGPFLTKSIAETRNFAASVLDALLELPDRDDAVVIGLSGELGAGKTTFTQEMADLLGVEETVTSPTFVIMKSYRTRHDRFKMFFHIDAYRLKSGEELLTLEWRKILRNPRNLICLEWPSYVEDVLPQNIITISIESKGEFERNFTTEGL